jgi:acyl-homoserine-lactone acylase
VTSEEGLNAYGAATWGQFFVYQGFNERTGWMHTSSGVDECRRVRREGRKAREAASATSTARIAVRSARGRDDRYRTRDGTFKAREFADLAHPPGPIVREGRAAGSPFR